MLSSIVTRTFLDNTLWPMVVEISTKIESLPSEATNDSELTDELRSLKNWLEPYIIQYDIFVDHGKDRDAIGRVFDVWQSKLTDLGHMPKAIEAIDNLKEIVSGEGRDDLVRAYINQSGGKLPGKAGLRLGFFPKIAFS